MSKQTQNSQQSFQDFQQLIYRFVSKNAIHFLFVGLIVSTLAVGLSSFRYLDLKGRTTLAAPVQGSTPTTGGNITIDKAYTTTANPTESDNVSVSAGDTITVRLKYDNTGNVDLTGASIKDSLPAGFTYLPGSTKNCLVPTTAETTCDSGTVSQKDFLFTALTSTNGVSPTAGLYDAADTGATGTDYSATAGLLEIGKKRYLNLNQCYYAASYSYTQWIKNPQLSGYTAGTDVSNTQQPLISCGAGQSGYGFGSPSSGLQNLDLRNKKYFNLSQCIYSNGNDYYTAIIDNVNYSPYNTGTKTSNSIQPLVSCGVGYITYNYLPQSNLSGVKNLQLLGNRYINLAHCGYSTSSNNVVTAVDTTTEAGIWANTNASNTISTTSCGNGVNFSAYSPITTDIQNLDLLDQTRGQGYIEYKMTAPATAGVFGTNVTLVGTDNVGAKTVSDLGSANQVTVNGVVASSSSSVVSVSSTIASSSTMASTSSIPGKAFPYVSKINGQNYVAGSTPTFNTRTITIEGFTDPNSYIQNLSSFGDPAVLGLQCQGFNNVSVPANATVPANILWYSIQADSMGKWICNLTYPGDGAFQIFTRTETSVPVYSDQINTANFIIDTTTQASSSSSNQSSSLLASAVSLLASSSQAASSQSTSSTSAVNLPPLNVTINQAAGQADPSSTNQARFSVVFNKPIDAASFTTDQIALTGTATGSTVTSITQISPNDGTTFEVLVSAAGGGTVIANVKNAVSTYSISSFGRTGARPFGIALDQFNNKYVSNNFDNNVTKITPAGVSSILGTTGLGSNPAAIITDSAGNIYTANSGSNNVTKITPAGVSSILGTTGTAPTSIGIDAAGNIYTANNGSNNVTKITPAGVSSIFGTTGLGSNPAGIVIDNTGNVYTANATSNNITKITPAGVSSILGTTGAAPTSIGIDAAGNIYTANFGSNNVTKITPAGVSSILGTTGLGTNPIAITVDSAGNIYTANYGSNNVTKITPAGVSTIIGNTESIPKSLIVDLTGDVFVVNSELPIISKFTLNNVGIKSLSNNYYLSNSTSTDNVVSITAPATPKFLTGKIFLDTNNNGIQDPGEPDFSITNPVISGTNIFVEGVSNRNLDNSGTYSVDLNSTPQIYNISLSAPAGFSFSSSTNLGDATIISPGVLRVVSDASRSFSFGSHGIHPDPLSTGSIEITDLNYGASAISGFVYEDTNNNGIKEAGEKPIPNVTITATGLSDGNTGLPVTVALRTDVNGKYTFTNYNTYNNNLSLTQTQPSGYTTGINTLGNNGIIDGDYTFCSRGTVNLNVFSGICISGITGKRIASGYNFGQLLAPASTITGKIYYDTNNNGIQDANEPDFNSTTNRLPVGTTITLTNKVDATKIYYPSFNIDGTYSQNVDPGTYLVTINPAYNYNVTTSTELGDGIGANPTTVTVALGQTKSAGKDGLHFNPPVAVDDNYTTDQGIPFVLNPKPINNDSGIVVSTSSVTGQSIRVTNINGTITTPGLNQTIPLPKGNLSIDSFDTYTFNSLPTDSGQITFPYTIIDNNTGLTASANITINIVDPCALPTGPPTASATACGVVYTPLEVTINQAATQIDPTTAGPVKFTVVFNQPINTSTFTAADIALSGTAPGLSVVSITQVAPNDGTTFEVLVNATGNGTVIANVPAGTNANNTSNQTITDLGFLENQAELENSVVDTFGNLYFLSTNSTNNNGVITKIDLNNSRTVFATISPSTKSPFKMVIDSQNNLYVDALQDGSANLYKVSSVGSVTTFTINGPDNGVLSSISPNDDIYTFNPIINSSDLKIFKTTSTGITTEYLLNSNTISVNGVKGDALGNFYILNYTTHIITKFSPTGVSSIFATVPASSVNFIIDSGNSLFVFDQGDTVITKILLNGSSSNITPTSSGVSKVFSDKNNNIYLSNVNTFCGQNQTIKSLNNPSVNIVTPGINFKYELPAFIGDSKGNLYFTNSASCGEGFSPPYNLFRLSLPNSQNSGNGIQSANDPTVFNNNSTSTDNTVTIFSVIDTSTTVTISVPTLTNNPKPPITGACETGANLVVKVTKGNANPTLQTVSETLSTITCVGGTYSTVATINLPDGPYCATVVATDIASNTATAQSCGVIDTSTFITTTVPALTNNPRPAIIGTCEPNGTVTIRITTGSPSTTINQTLPSFTCDSTGIYTVNPQTNIPDGPYCGNATIVDLATNTATAIQSCGVIDASTFITIVVPPITNNPRPAITGTCENGALVTIKITIGANNTINQTLPTFACVGGVYSINPTIDIPQGAYCARADATDVAGNTAFAKGCGDIFVTVSVPQTTTDNKPEIIGTCTPSVLGGYQVPIKIVIKVGSTYGTLNETLNTICTTAGTYRVRPNVIIPTGLFQVTATATDSIGNQATAVAIGTVIQTLIDPKLPGGVIIITETKPEIFDNISDPYECGQSITGQVSSNYGISTVVIKLFARRGDGSYEADPKYIFRPTIDTQGKYKIDLAYNDSIIFVKGQYKVEYTSQSKTNAIKIGSYLATITNQCNIILPTVALQNTEITPEGKVTIRTGGGNELFIITSIFAIILGSYGYWKLKNRDSTVEEIFGK